MGQTDAESWSKRFFFFYYQFPGQFDQFPGQLTQKWVVLIQVNILGFTGNSIRYKSNSNFKVVGNQCDCSKSFLYVNTLQQLTFIFSFKDSSAIQSYFFQGFADP